MSEPPHARLSSYADRLMSVRSSYWSAFITSETLYASSSLVVVANNPGDADFRLVLAGLLSLACVGLMLLCFGMALHATEVAAIGSREAARSMGNHPIEQQPDRFIRDSDVYTRATLAQVARRTAALRWASNVAAMLLICQTFLFGWFLADRLFLIPPPWRVL